ncbi:uncharacterized protein LOC115228999 [Octopus sinensis]|uniref:Uncharacterized protein LOC115228999 n=1 Tax=Octopus sinensis TaxID=2607531 RepID=A0A6P7TZD0_9MOLL|nr:uncharacterized protein LOC115228999 [Octopus sinensis]
MIQKWLKSFISGRLGRTLFMSKTSHARYLPNKVPQRSALSPALFNFHLSSLPELEDTLILFYADDLILAARDKNISIACTRLQTHLDLLESWFVTNHLSPSFSKSSVTLFTSDRRQLDQHPELKIFEERLPISKTPKILGVIYDQCFTFSSHVDHIIKKLNKKRNALRAVAGSSFGQDKEKLRIIYKQYIRISLNYTSPAWAASLSSSNI